MPTTAKIVSSARTTTRMAPRRAGRRVLVSRGMAAAPVVRAGDGYGWRAGRGPGRLQVLRDRDLPAGLHLRIPHADAHLHGPHSDDQRHAVGVRRGRVVGRRPVEAAGPAVVGVKVVLSHGSDWRI